MSFRERRPSATDGDFSRNDGGEVSMIGRLAAFAGGDNHGI
jgi:hypothetical protein